MYVQCTSCFSKKNLVVFPLTRWKRRASKDLLRCEDDHTLQTQGNRVKVNCEEFIFLQGVECDEYKTTFPKKHTLPFWSQFQSEIFCVYVIEIAFYDQHWNWFYFIQLRPQKIDNGVLWCFQKVLASCYPTLADRAESHCLPTQACSKYSS